MSKLIIPPGSARSKVYEIAGEVEASYLAMGSHEDAVLQVRMADGRWVKLETWRRRVEALGIKIDETWRSRRPGEHAVGL